MTQKLFLTLVLIAFHFCFQSAQAQVWGLDYYIEFNPDDCQYDANIIINEGSAEFVFDRILFNHSYTIVVPVGSVVSVDTSYAPYVLNTSSGNELSNMPVDYSVSMFVNDTMINSSKAFYKISAPVAPIAAFDTIALGDTIALFGFSVDPLICDGFVRPFDISVDPSSNETGGFDFQNGMLIGGIDQLYNFNRPTQGLPIPQIDFEIICNDSISLIPIVSNTTTCVAQLSYFYSWSGPNGFTSMEESPIIPYSVGSGEYCLTIVDNLGCDSTSCRNLTIQEPFFISEVVCSSSTYDLSSPDEGEGVWRLLTTDSASEVTLDTTINGVAQVIFSEIASGLYEFVFDNDECGGRAELFILSASFTAPSDLCINSGVQLGLGSGLPTGGVYSGPGVTDDGNGTSFSFDPSLAGVGTSTLTYTLTTSEGCEISTSDDVEVLALPVVAFTAPADLCIEAGVQGGLSGGASMPMGQLDSGVYSGSGVTDGADGLTYSFDPALAGVGLHTITYAYTNEEGCTNFSSDDIEVFDLPQVSLTTVMGYCLDAPIQSEPLFGGVPSGGVYSGTGVVDAGDGTSYTFDPTVNGVGIVMIAYTFTDVNGCTNSATSDIEIYGCAVEIADPCTCLDNATSFDIDNNTGGDDGQFSEVVSVQGPADMPLPAGQIWSVSASTGGFDAFNVPPVGTQSTRVPIMTDGSVTLTYNTQLSRYEMPFVHFDDLGYSITVEGPFAAGDAGNTSLMIGNKCQYPDPLFDPVVPSMINVADASITLGGADQNGETADAVSFTFDGVSITEIDPSQSMMGTYTLNMNFNGSDDGNSGVSPDGGITAASPGCMQEVIQSIEIIECMLEVDCSAVRDSSIACRSDLPPVDFDLPVVVDSCGEITLSALTLIGDNTGCPGDEEMISRTYFIQDSEGNMAECMQTFTVVSLMAPSFTFLPPDTMVLCGAATDPSATGMAMGAQECNFATGPDVTFNDVLVDGMCPAERNITRTWTVTDGCGRSVSMDQTISVVDTIAPTIMCQNVTTFLDSAGMASITSADVDNGSNDNCGGVLSLSLNESTFTCDGTGENTVWLLGEDACGNQDSCMATITVLDTISPVIMCPADIIVDSDMGVCGSAVEYVVTATDNCGFSILQTAGLSSGEEFPAGTTTNTFVVTDLSGNTTQCSFNVTVVDAELPTVTCPMSMTLPTDDGVCERIIVYEVSATDNCQFVIDQTEGLPSGASFPQGTTTNTFVVTDDGGNMATCSFDIEIVDEEAPIILNCPADMTINLGAGECNTIVDFDLMYSENCSMNPVISQNVNNELIDDGVNCGSNFDAAHLRRFENTSIIPLLIEDITFGVFETNAQVDVAVNVYSIAAGADLTYANMILEGTGIKTLEAGISQMLVIANVPVRIEPGDDFVLEVVTAMSTDLIVGYNDEGQSDPSFMGLCNEPNPFQLADMFGQDFSVVLFVSNVTIIQTAGLASGSVFDRGVTTNTFLITDANGNSAECSFDVTVEEFSTPINALACNNSINISLNSNCQVELNVDMLLEGGPYGCYDDFEIFIQLFGNESEKIGPFSGGLPIDLPLGTHAYEVVDPDTGNMCWGALNVEDKRAPILECACEEVIVSVDLPFTGSLDAGSPTWTRPFGQPGACNPSGVGVGVSYNTHEFQLDMSDNVGAEVVTFTGGDSFIALYAGGFDPLDPCANMMINNDDGGSGALSQFDVMLDDDVVYILVVTTFGPGTFGDYDVDMTTDATLIIENDQCIFRCTDIDLVFNDDSMTPNTKVTSCTPADLTFTDELTTDDCGTSRIVRTWVATNANGTSQCTQEFLFEPLEIADLTLPTSPLELSCNDGTDPEIIVAMFDNPLTTDNPNTPWIENNEGFVNAYPTYLVNGQPQKVDDDVCDIYAGFTDQELPSCTESCVGNRKVLRTWTLVDWCTLEIATYVQTIKAVDTEAPTLVIQDVTISTDPWDCDATFEAPRPSELHDNCDDNPDYDISGPAGVIIVGNSEIGFTIQNVMKGDHVFFYNVFDCCDNRESYPFMVTVIDGTAPVVVLKQNIAISLTSGVQSEDGMAKLFAESMDNGSYDGCSDKVKLEVRRDTNICDVAGTTTYNADGHPQDGSPNPNSPNFDPDGGAFVQFCCADITNAVVDVDGDDELDAGYVKVWLRVFDDGDMDGMFGSAGDNFNEAWAYVKVEDKLSPAIQCPADVTLNCDMDYTDLDITGEATAFRLCGSVPVEYNDIIITLNSCNEGFVRRRWSVVGQSGIFCDQTIVIDAINGPDPMVSFSGVGDREFAGCPENVMIGEPTWIGGPCDVLGYTVETDTIRFEDGACFKLVNEYTVINWCDYDPNSDPDAGVWRHTQVVTYTDETLPMILDCEDQMYEINDHADSDADGNVCEAVVNLTNSATDSVTDNCPMGWLKWRISLDLWGDGTIDYEWSSFLPSNDRFDDDDNGNGILDAYVAPTVNGGTVSVDIPETIPGSMSNHKVDWKVTDGCNNVMTCSTEFVVVDKKPPTPYCTSVSTAVMTMGADNMPGVELWASDFNIASFDNCTATEDLLYSFSGESYVSSRTFTCDDVSNTPVEVNMYVWDEKGNNDFCVVFLTIEDNQGLCSGTGGMRVEVGGIIVTEDATPVNAVEVMLHGSELITAQGSDDGSYTFADIMTGRRYNISASNDVDYLNGVSTLDLVKMQRHILGLESLDSPYKLIAADINADNAVKVNDLSQLRKLILGVITDLPTNESWRFVNGSQTLHMDTDLNDVQYGIEINNLQATALDNHMVGVKVGDVTGNAVPNLKDQNVSVRSRNAVEFIIDNTEVSAGETVEVTFRSADFVDVYGFQFTMELNGLVYKGIQGGAVAMNEANVGVFANDVVTVSYSNSTARSAGVDEAVFTATFTATEDGTLANMIYVSSRVTTAEAYVTETLDVRDVAISTSNDLTSVASNALHQNEPNPFKGMTKVAFDLVEASPATLTIFDVTGKLINKTTIEAVRGYNVITIDAEQLGTSGVLYYTLESGDFTATKKLVVVR